MDRLFSLTLGLTLLLCPATRATAEASSDEPAPRPVVQIAPASFPGILEELNETDDAFIADPFNGATNRLWIEGQYHLAWIKGVSVPALVTTSPGGTLQSDAGVLPGATTLFGDDRIDDNGRPGAGLDFGWWLDDEQYDALVLSWYSLGDGANNGHFSATSLGSPILARPFFNVDSGQEDAELVAFPGVLEGTVSVVTSSELHSLTADKRLNWLRGPRGRVDFLVGYRYLRFRDAISITEDLISIDPASVIEVGTNIVVMDQFSAENDFHGGGAGVAAEFYYGVLTMEWLAKLSVGNIHQDVTIDGRTFVTTPSDPTVASSGGLLALPTNMGRWTNDKLALLPELRASGRIALTNNCDLTVGYSLLYLTDAVRAGHQIDRQVNPTQIGGTLSGTPRPAVLRDDASLWAHSVVLGLRLLR